jgi:ribonuclease VapC
LIIDTSALIAILRDEAERAAFNDAIARAETCQISAVTFVEASIVIETSRGYDGLRDLDLLIATADITITPVDAEQARLARRAYSDYGKGKSAAGLNYGDCFSYALAKITGQPLLFKGNDFSQTDIEVVL